MTDGSFSQGEIDHLCREAAKKFNVKPDIHEKDFIFDFVMNNPTFPTKKDAIDYYFVDGDRSAKKLSDLIYDELRYSRGTNLELLEFASGYGCLTRHLSRHMPDVHVTSCDIHREAIDFIRSTFMNDVLLSRSAPEDVAFDKKYDVVFALSFFSHMPRATWGRWVKTLFSGVKDNGFLVFTTHGRLSAKFIGATEIPEGGFWYKPFSEQQDIDTAEYGVALVTPEFVIREIYEQIKAPLALYREGFWWTHQDLYVVAKL